MALYKKLWRRFMKPIFDAKIPTYLLLAIGMVVSSCVAPPPQLPPIQPPRAELPRVESVAPQVPTKGSNLTPGMISKNIVVKKTSQAEVMEIFGPPNMVTRTGNGEMWGYDKVSREVVEVAVGAKADASSGAGTSASMGGGIGILGLGGAVGGVGGLVGSSGSTANARQSMQQNAAQTQRLETTTTVFLLIYFDDKGVVSDFRVSATKF
jgi:hypothetical protein